MNINHSSRQQMERFRFNADMLQLIEELDKNSDTRLIHDTPRNYQQRVKELDAEHKKKGLEVADKKFLAKIERAEEEEKERKFWWKRKDLLNKEKKACEQRRERFLKEIVEAKRLLQTDKPFYQRIKMDHRGRMYFPHELSIQGSDFARSVIEFDRGMNIDIKGWEALLMHTQNMGEGSADHDIQLDQALKNADVYLQIGLDPVGEFKHWKDADKPYSYLRACREVADGMALTFQNPTGDENYSEEEKELIGKATARWKSTGRGELGLGGGIIFSTHLPVEMDQANSAFQHIGMMMGDEELMAYANMGPTYTDIYTTLADSKEMEIDGLDNPKEKRKIIKTVAISWGYGAEWKTGANDLDKFRREKPEKAQYLWTLDIQGVNRVAQSVHRLLKKRFPTVIEYRKRIEDCVTQVEQAGIKDRIDFMTPLLFHTVVRKCKSDEIPARVFSGQDASPTELGKHTIQLRVRRPGEVLWKAEKKEKTEAEKKKWKPDRQNSIQSAMPAALIHSMDAALIHGVLAFGEFSGHLEKDTGKVWADFEAPTKSMPYPVATCHDAFFCLAPVAADLKQKLEQGLKKLYEDFNPLDAFLTQNSGNSGWKRAKTSLASDQCDLIEGKVRPSTGTPINRDGAYRGVSVDCG